MKKQLVKEDMGGGISAPNTTLGSVNGVGNAVPASMAGMTGAQQSSPNSIGSGDSWGNSLTKDPYHQGSLKKKRKKKKSKKHKIKTLESYLSSCSGVLNEKVDEPFSLDNVELVPYKKISNEQRERVRAIAREHSPYLHLHVKTLNRAELKSLQVALFNDEVIGYFCPEFDTYRETWDVAPIKIAEKYKGKGIGGKIISEFFSDKSGHVYIYDANTASIKAFLAAGFKKLENKKDDPDGHYYKK
jgi:L-amino acid N-acyltransferase YncA